MTKQAEEFIVESVKKHVNGWTYIGPQGGVNWRDIALLSVRMASCWMVAKHGGLPWPGDLPPSLLKVLLHNHENGTLDSPTMPEV